MVPAQIIGPPLAVAQTVLFLAAALHDVATRTIPNRLVLGIGGTEIICQFLAGSTSSAMMAAAAILTFAAFCWRQGYLGGGDAKLIAAACLVVAPDQVISLILATAIAGGFLSIFYIALKSICIEFPHAARPPARWLVARILRVERHRLRHKITLPYATAIAAGTLFVLWRG